MTQQTQAKDLPKTGETYRCAECGMEVKVTQDCKCEGGQPQLKCCGQPLTKA